MSSDEKRIFSERKVDFPNGSYWIVFDVVKPAMWNEVDIQCWSLERMIVRKSSIEVMRFHSPTGQKPWSKAFNPYAGFAYKPQEAQRIADAIRNF